MGVYTIIDNRAWNSLKVVTEEFKTYFSIKNRESNKIEIDGEKLGVKKMYSSYKVMNKWMGRIYLFQWNCLIEDNKPSGDQTIKLHYTGKLIGSKQPKFHSKSDHDLVSKLNNDKDVLEICNTIDFEKLELTYSKEKNGWNIEMWPNYGDFIWMLIPPVRYVRKPNKEEITKTIQLVKRINHVIKKE